MTRLRRHPSGPKLGAWFDGEEAAGVGTHVARCARCRRHVSEMARVRAWIRAQPFFAMGDESSAPAPLHRWRPAAVGASLLLLVALLVFNAPRLGRNEGPPDAGNSGPLLNQSSEGRAQPPEASEPGGPAGGPSGGEPGQDAAQRRSSPLVLGLVVPARGPAAREGSEVRETVRRRVDLANATGGVGGLPVQLVVAAAEDQAAVAALPSKTSALVGGFGAPPPPGSTWLFPADPSIMGPNVVPAELSPEAAGQHLGELLRRQGPGGPVGVVQGGGPERGLAVGLASKLPTTAASAPPGSPCLAEVASLRVTGAAALAVAGPPELALRCLKAARATGWSPRLGTVVAPSAAYAGLHSLPEAEGSRTVLALPWPSSPAAGAARFRAVAGSQSYRALVSFAATELAIDVTRGQGTISMPRLSGGTWKSDLFELRGTAGRPTLVAVTPRGWLPVADQVPPGPPPPIAGPPVPAVPPLPAFP